MVECDACKELGVHPPKKAVAQYFQDIDRDKLTFVCEEHTAKKQQAQLMTKWIELRSQEYLRDGYSEESQRLAVRVRNLNSDSHYHRPVGEKNANPRRRTDQKIMS